VSVVVVWHDFSPDPTQQKASLAAALHSLDCNTAIPMIVADRGQCQKASAMV
jgi:hypothetical protein